MSLKKLIEEKLNEALKSKDKKTYPTLRLIVSAIKDAEIAGRSKGQKDIVPLGAPLSLIKFVKFLVSIPVIPTILFFFNH